MRSILIPTDFSSASYQAMQFARDLAGKSTTRFSMMHVYKNECINLFPSYRDQAVSIMKNLFKDYKLSDRPHRCFVREGDISDCVAKATREQADSFVIMGRNVVPGDGLKQGTAFKIVQKVSCPVLFIPQGRLQYPVKEIVYAVNAGESGQETFKSILEFASELNAHVTYLNILPVNTSGTYGKELSKEILHSGHYDLSSSFIRADDIYSGIKLYLEDHKADIIAVDTCSDSILFRKFRKSLVALMLAQNDFPVLFLNNTRFYHKLKALSKTEIKNEHALVS